MSTSSPSRSATHRGVDVWKIVTWAGLFLAGSLCAVDPLELLSAPVVPISFVAAEPDQPAPVVIEIGVTSVSVATENEGSTQLFGMNTEPVADGALLDKWRRVQAVIAKDLEVIAQC